MLLGVRKNTFNFICYAELGYSTLSDLLQYKQHKLFHKLWQERSGMNDDLFILLVTIINAMNTPVAKIVRRYTLDDVTDMSLLI